MEEMGVSQNGENKRGRNVFLPLPHVLFLKFIQLLQIESQYFISG
jgi:hypothetical protein